MAGDNGNFISARILLQINKYKILIAYCSWIWYNFIHLVIFYKLIFFSRIVSRTGDLSSADRRRSADHDCKNHWLIVWNWEFT